MKTIKMNLANTADLLFAHQYAEIHQLFNLIKILHPDHEYTKFLIEYTTDIINNVIPLTVNITLTNGVITDIDKEYIAGQGLEWIITQIREHIKNSQTIKMNLTSDFYLYQGLYYPQGVCQINGVNIVDKEHFYSEHKFKLIGCINLGKHMGPWLMIQNNKYTIISSDVKNETLDLILDNIRNSGLYNIYKYVELNMSKDKLLVYPDRTELFNKSSQNIKMVSNNRR